MADMQIDEMAILKATSIKLSEDIVLIATLQYHTEPGNRNNSRYRWVARVVNIAEATAEAERLMTDENRLNAWYWPNDFSWDGKITCNGSTNARASTWIKTKLKKAVSVNEGPTWLHGFSRKTKSANPNAAYDTEGYKSSNGDENISIADFNSLMNRVGQTLIKEKEMPSKIKRARLEAERRQREIAMGIPDQQSQA